MILKLNVNSDKSIVEVQNEFNRLFPYLRIEFPPNGQLERDGEIQRGTALHKGTIGQFSIIQNSDAIEINEDLSVAELKKMFKTAFGLTVKIFRKSDNFWLETNLTEKLTLARQNKHGKDLS